MKLRWLNVHLERVRIIGGGVCSCRSVQKEFRSCGRRQHIISAGVSPCIRSYSVDLPVCTMEGLMSRMRYDTVQRHTRETCSCIGTSRGDRVCGSGAGGVACICCPGLEHDEWNGTQAEQVFVEDNREERWMYCMVAAPTNTAPLQGTRRMKGTARRTPPLPLAICWCAVCLTRLQLLVFFVLSSRDSALPVRSLFPSSSTRQQHINVARFAISYNIHRVE